MYSASHCYSLHQINEIFKYQAPAALPLETKASYNLIGGCLDSIKDVGSVKKKSRLPYRQSKTIHRSFSPLQSIDLEAKFHYKLRKKSVTS